MTTKKKPVKPAYVSRYLGIDSHLSERNGSTDQVYDIAAERPAGRKLAEDIAKCCNQLDGEGYEVLSVFSLTSGRTAEVAVEAGARVYDLTYQRDGKDYLDTGVGYSVTDGVIVTARLRK
jgi:hypothetical protein